MVQEVPHAAAVAVGPLRHGHAATLSASVGRTPPRFSGNLVTGCFGMKLPRHKFPGVIPGIFRAGFRTGNFFRLTRVGELSRMPKVFSVMAHAPKTKIPPDPPLSKGGKLQGIALKVPLWKREI